MFNQFKKIFFIIFFFIFVFLITKHYLSEKNIKYTNKSRSNYYLITREDLPILENDTSNIIMYKNGLEEFKKKRKKRIWEKLISDDNK